MSASDFARGDLTAWLLEKMATTLVVGDAIAPEAGGWDGPPTKDGSGYQAYVVLTPMPAQDSSGPFGDSSADWILPYRIDSYGVSREQVEYQADTARALIRPTNRENLTAGGASYRIQQIRTTSLGGVGRSDQTEPSEYSQSDIVAVYVSKEL